MKVLLRQDVQGLGRRGDIVTVKPGYARNYLLPSGTAVSASAATEGQSAAMQRSRDLADAKSREAAEVQRTAIESATVTIASRAGANGHLYGSVGETEIAHAVTQATGVAVDRHQVHLDEHLKSVGPATATISLFGGVVATVSVEVVAK